MSIVLIPLGMGCFEIMNIEMNFWLKIIKVFGKGYDKIYVEIKLDRAMARTQ